MTHRPTTSRFEAHNFEVQEYAPDALTARNTLVRIIISALVGGVFTLGSWYVLRATSLPAFNTSMVLRALSAAGTLFVLAAVGVLCYFWMHDERRTRWLTWLTEVVCGLAPAALVITTLGIPLSATRLYLDGIQVDQGFRTQFLSRMVQTASNHDMAYMDLPTFYPIGWFWLGGRMGSALGLTGWETYQPWSLVSMAMAASALVPIWRKLTGSLPVGTFLSMGTTAIILHLVPDEPYAAVVAMFAPAVVIMASFAFRGNWKAIAAITVFLGISACFYTLYTAILAATMVVYAVVIFFSRDRSWRPFAYLAVMGFGSMLIALISWGPYLLAVLRFDGELNSTANHFLPADGTVFPLPFFQLSLLGLITLIGLIYIIARMANPSIGALGIAVGVGYVWCIASMVLTAAGTSLLGFRIEVLISLLLGTAGILAISDLRLTGIDYLYPEVLTARGQRVITAVVMVLLSLGCLSYLQRIPFENEHYIDQAYVDTDGYGERGDRRSPDAGKYYQEVSEFITSHGHEPSDTVVLTDEVNFMGYQPFYAFNAFTSHYANPLGEFEKRNETIIAWGKGSFEDLSDPEKFLAALDEAPWRAPDAFLFRGSEKDTDVPWKTHVAHDIYPNQPNVRYDALYFNPESFDSEAWAVKHIGPFVVVVRNS